MVRCHQKLGQLKEASVLLSTLKTMKLSREQEGDVDQLIETIKRAAAVAAAVAAPGEDISGEEKEQSFSSDALQIAESDSQGRYVVAGRNVKVGETLLSEKPFAAIPYSKQFGTHCQTCLKRTETFLVCPRCTTTVFCSQGCLEEASDTFHPHECQINGLLEVLGCSQISRLAVRMMVQHPAKYYLRQSKNEYYGKIQSLVGNNSYRWEEDRKKRAFLVGCLVRMLKCSCTSRYFDGLSTQDEQLLASVLLRNLEILQFNAHEIYEVVRNGTPLIPNKSLGIGLGIYSMASYFNHSCHGGVARYRDM